ncbi:MAG: LmbE family N-acetylglucosaminyl deacetylase [Verrucomicrobiales bacterium]|jgi:LmbE family N-acetylglucosaminyl deacetylase
MSKTAFAIFAHPDDIEFAAAGTLLHLKAAGWETHYLTLSGGDCGSMVFTAQQTAEIRAREAATAAGILGAKFHPAFCKDLQIFYDIETLRHIAGVMREVNPSIVLTHSTEDYMEDHTNTSRLALTAAFARVIPNFGAQPPTEAAEGDVTVYHAMPHGLRDPLRRRIVPGAYVETSKLHETKRAALAAHASQKDWLDKTQGMDSYIKTLDDFSSELGRMSGNFEHAEGWRRHLHYGFSGEDIDPLAEALGENYLVNQAYEDAINRGEVPTL